MLDRVADLMVDGKVVGLYQGRFEWGPRALGNRSIMADPRRAEMKEIVNVKIKFREPFRPFAPVILEEKAADYFEFPDIPRPVSAQIHVDGLSGQGGQRGRSSRHDARRRNGPACKLSARKTTTGTTRSSGASGKKRAFQSQ